MSNRVVNWFHTILLLCEVVILESLVFLLVVPNLKFADHIYSSQTQELKFSIAPGQDEEITSVEYYRVDYTVKTNSWTCDDSGFKVEQMIRVEKDLKNPYREYRVSLPPKTLSVSINFHPSKKASNSVLLNLSEVKIGDSNIKVSELEHRFNPMWNFYSWRYTPHPFMKGYGSIYAVVLCITVLLVCYASYRYRKL